MESRDPQGTFKIDFTSGDATQIDATRTFEAIDAPFTAAKKVRIPVGDYDYTQLKGSYTFGAQRRVSGTATARYAEPTVSWNRLDVPWGKGNTNLVSSRLTYTVSPRMFVSALVQYQSRTDSISTNASLRWEYRPSNELFVVYSDGRTTLGREVPDVQNRSFVVKVTRLFRL